MAVYNPTNPGPMVTIAATSPLKTYLCPTRRTTSAGPAVDYAGVHNASLTEYMLTNYWKNATAYRSILQTPGVTMSAITNGAGTSGTILLAHKVLQPRHYLPYNQSSQDRCYVYNSYNAGLSYDNYNHMRWADGYGGGASKQRGYTPDSNSVDENHFGGPHPGGSPVLWADGSIKIYNYGYTSTGYNWPDCAVWQAFWAYNRDVPLTAP